MILITFITNLNFADGIKVTGWWQYDTIERIPFKKYRNHYGTR